MGLTTTSPGTSPLVEKEATIIGTEASSIGWSNDPARLIDGLGLDGFLESGGCAHTDNKPDPPWFSLELDAPQYVTKVQITRRLQNPSSNNPNCCPIQGQGIRITVGPSSGYNSSEPLCRSEIPDLDYGGLTDYSCAGNLHQGKFVKISKAKGYLVICEVKVFVADTPSMLYNLLSYVFS